MTKEIIRTFNWSRGSPNVVFAAISPQPHGGKWAYANLDHVVHEVVYSANLQQTSSLAGSNIGNALTTSAGTNKPQW